MKLKDIKQLGILPILAALVLVAPAQAISIDVEFTRITNNNVEDVASQLGVTIFDSVEANATYGGLGLAGNQLLFTVSNAVGIASSVSEFYLQDSLGLLVPPPIIVNDLNGFTLFVAGPANPGNLPGGNQPGVDFTATQVLSADAQGNPSRGVDTGGDLLGIIYTLSGAFDISDVDAALLSNDFRIGMHLRAIGQAGGSDSFVNQRGPIPMAEPTTLAMLGLGLVLAGLAGRRRNAR